MAKSEVSRKGRKLRKPAAAADEEQQIQKPAAPQEKRSSSSRRSKRSSSSRRSRRSQKVEMAFMAEGDEEPAADAPAEDAPAEDAPAEDAPAEGDAEGEEAPAEETPPAETGALEPVTDEQKAIDEAVEKGEFKTEFINVDKEDIEAIKNKAFATTAINARGRIHDFCDDCEILAELMLTDALKNKGGRERCLQARMALLTRLWTYRDTSDCEDDFPIEEFHKEMRLLATVQRKLRSLDSKISALMLGADDDSSDTDGEGEAQNLSSLKQARQNLRYSLGESQAGFT